MTSHDILDMIGDARGEYLMEAQAHRDKKVQPQRKRLSLKRTMLIAAVIVLSLLLVGCAVVYVLSLNDLALGEKVRENRYEGTSEVRTMLSIQGVKGTPGYLASKEWYEWLQNYDTDEAIYHSEEAFSEDFGEEYYAYNLYSREMKDKVDELCEKYDLELLGMLHMDTEVEYMFQALNIPGILKSGTEAETDWGGCYYENGSFEVEGQMTLTGADSPWPHEMLLSFGCNRKDAFGDLYASVGPIGTYEEWTYTTSDGVDVLMVMEEDSALLMVDRGEYFFIVSGIETRAQAIIDNQYGIYTMDKAALEYIAESFDFTIAPQRVTQEDIDAAQQRREEEAQKRNEEYQQKLAKLEEFWGKGSFEARVKYHLENGSPRLGFAFRDLDGDGNAELLIGKDGYINHIYAEKDGETIEIVGWWGGTYHLTDDGGLATTEYVGSTIPSRYFYQVVNGELVLEKNVLYAGPYFYPEGESPFRLCYSVSDDNPITEEEFWEVYRSKKRVVLDFLPLTEYPLETVEVTIPDSEGPYHVSDWTYEDCIREYLLMPIEAEPGVFIDYEYALIDLDGDGQEELFFSMSHDLDGPLPYSNQSLSTLYNGKMADLFSGEYVHLYEGGIVGMETIIDETRVYLYYQLEGAASTLVEYLRYDADKDPSNPWFRSSDASGQDISLEPISEREFEAIRAKYVPLELDMKPISEYPLS